MCGRFFLDFNDQDHIFTWLRKHCRDFLMQGFQVGEVFPSQKVLALCASEHTLKPQIFLWGMLNHASKRVINARLESVETKQLFQASLYNRCIVVASGFYEWKQIGNKLYKVRIERPGQLLYMAGIYNAKQELVILTGASFGEMASIHNRCPIIIDEANLLDYLYYHEMPKARNIFFTYEMIDKPEYMQETLF